MATEIKYNGNTIANLENGKAAILNCENKKMADNIVIVVNEPATEVVPEYEGDITIGGREGLINFTVDGTSYQAEDGMTWGEWCDSSYNTDGFWVQNEYTIKASDGGNVQDTTNSDVGINKAIISGYSYRISYGGSND